MASETTAERRGNRGMGAVVDRNIRALLARRAEEQKELGLSGCIAERITRFTGSMPFVYLHLVIYGLWIAINLGWVPLPRFDPTFVMLAMAASVEAIFLSTFVLITQNRMSELAEKRAELDLQISLLAEHEITRVIQLVGAVAAHLGLEEAYDPELSELKKDIDPERVLDKIDQASLQSHRNS